MRKLARSFFWIDQEVLRSGIWQRLTVVERLIYIALVASANREGICLWGSEKLLTLAGCTKSEWDSGLIKLIEFKLIQPPKAGEFGIELLSLELGVDGVKSEKLQEQVSDQKSYNMNLRQPLILKTTTTLELGEFNADSKDAK